MWLLDYTINTDSLASLAVAVGLVVDNAIVVVDNIHRHRVRGQRPKEGAVFGANEVGVAVIASTLTTISIFLPIMFVGGITAIIFGQFAAIVTMALVASRFDRHDRCSRQTGSRSCDRRRSHSLAATG